jgi:hypothetical protein
MALQSTTELFSEPAVGLCIAVLVWGALRWRARSRFAPVVIGLAAGAAIQFRADSMLTVWIGLLALPLFVPWRSVVRPVNLAALGIPMAISAVALGAYNYVRWHSVVEFSYNGQGFHTPIGRGLEGLLFSPGKGLFLFNPIALLGVIGLGVLLRYNRPVGLMFLLLIVPRLLFFSRWDAWQGGIDWGPRFLMPVLLLFVVAAVEILHRTSGRTVTGIAGRGAFVILCVASVGVSYLSVRVPYEQWWGTLTSPTLAAPFEHGGELVDHPEQPNATSNAYDFTYRASQIRGDVDLLQQGKAEMAPVEFGGKDSSVGWILLLPGAAALLGAAIGAVRSDRLASRPRRARDPEARAIG